MNRPQRNHNPGNLEYRGQTGAVGQDGRFAIFADDPTGWRALLAQISLDAKRGLTLGQFMAKYAPADENDLAAYTAFVLRHVSARQDDLLSAVSNLALAAAIAMFEGYFAPPGA